MSVLDMTVIGCGMIGAILTGTLLSSATKWGYFKRWWVVAKIVITALVLIAALGALHGLILDALATARQPIAPSQVPKRGASASQVMAGFGFTTLSLIAAAVISEYSRGVRPSAASEMPSAKQQPVRPCVDPLQRQPCRLEHLRGSVVEKSRYGGGWRYLKGGQPRRCW